MIFSSTYPLESSDQLVSVSSDNWLSDVQPKFRAVSRQKLMCRNLTDKKLRTNNMSELTG